MPAQDSARWVYLQQIWQRVAIAAKFFVAAAWLGPEAIGLVSIALVAMAMSEAISETGIPQALIQSSTEASPRTLGTAYVLTALRGGFLALLLFFGADLFALALGEARAAPLIALASAQCLLRNLFNPGLTLQSRGRQFRRLAAMEMLAVGLDLAVTLVLIRQGVGPLAIIIGSIAGESIRLLLSWTRFRVDMQLRPDWQGVLPLMRFGRWIWLNGILTALLNQLDKIIVARWFGSAELGQFQVAMKVAQICTVDVIAALAAYLFPTLAALNRESRRLVDALMRKVLSGLGLYCFALLVLAWLLMPTLTATPWMGDWSASAHLLKFALLPATVGCFLMLLSPYFRAIGQPQAITWATLTQLLCLGASAPLLISRWHTPGVAMAAALSGLVAIAVLALAYRQRPP
ncbi:oligosaccharide flippase family protein [Ideonella sp. 4Y11]|uniref:Oligosaccharide flippase family protein n=1 Tax=Ideonella aquatica TaxID=2824119 RepID=A0A941BPS0_9BURK|nr:oligosaccharide flippase family protein [Ideonella aquatica]MBQ0958350.1 oligosaccharide flippase family protein [Ideonella aquatica]